MPADRWIWKEWSRQCTVAVEAIKNGDYPTADQAIQNMQRIDAADMEKEQPEPLPFPDL
jgi:hypothetical protein